MTRDALERELLAIWREADATTRERVRRLLAGLLAGRVTLTPEEVRRLSKADVEALADCLPPARLANWLGKGRPN